MSTTFCTICRNLFNGIPNQVRVGYDETRLPSEFLIHHPNAFSLKQSMQAGCLLCTKIFSSFSNGTGSNNVSVVLESFAKVDMEIHTESSRLGVAVILVRYGAVLTQTSARMNILQFTLLTLSLNFNQCALVMSTLNDGIHNEKRIVLGSQTYTIWSYLLLELVPSYNHANSVVAIGESSDSEASCKQVKEWLNRCVRHHHHGAVFDAEITATFFPDRVLDIGRAGDFPLIKLVHKKDLGNLHESYTALSYCWGDSTHVRLETSTQSILETGIPQSQLPKTFRDAIFIAQELDIRYLWIDSLCILQDSKLDWAEQSAMMGKIYRYSRITIAATAAKSSHGGLFYNRDVTSIKPIQVECRFPFDRNMDSVRRRYNIVNQYLFKTPIETAPLNRRAWVMQERLLSQRILHCGSEQLMWECEEMFANESFPDGIKTTIDPLPSTFNHMLQDQISLQEPNKHARWFRLVEKYSNTKLTFSTDILIAISGLAKHWWSAIPNDEYLAGLWKSSLPLGLLWHEDHRVVEVQSRNKTWSAPTWSWASFTGAVRWDDIILPDENVPQRVSVDAVMIDILEACTVPADKEPTGQLKSGHIKLSGVLLTGVFNCDIRSADANEPYGIGSFMEKHGIIGRPFQLSTVHTTFKGYCQFESETYKSMPKENGEIGVICLPIVFIHEQEQRQDYATQSSIHVKGIILDYASRDEYSNGDFERVGYFSASASSLHERYLSRNQSFSLRTLLKELNDMEEDSRPTKKPEEKMTMEEALKLLEFGKPEEINIV